MECYSFTFRNCVNIILLFKIIVGWWSEVLWDYIDYIGRLYWAVVGLMDRALDLKPEITQGCGFESRLRQEVHDCSPGAAQSAAHCSKCVHLDGINTENTFHSSLYSV